MILPLRQITPPLLLILGILGLFWATRGEGKVALGEKKFEAVLAKPYTKKAGTPPSNKEKVTETLRWLSLVGTKAQVVVVNIQPLAGLSKHFNHKEDLIAKLGANLQNAS